MVGQGRDVLASLAQRGDPDQDHVEAPFRSLALDSTLERFGVPADHTHGCTHLVREPGQEGRDRGELLCGLRADFGASQVPVGLVDFASEGLSG